MAEQEKINEYFLSLVFSLSAAAMQQLGKISNPITNKIEKNLEQAKVSIDIIEMLVEKTKSNLTVEENKFITSTLSDLQLNFVDELDKDSKTEHRTN
ncbi:MAG: DUF1844 domain-containing protein [Elusimicrobiota bacterium]|nr:DUF1844 domain-containing protein [Elusimicrobiota bacterium]